MQHRKPLKGENGRVPRDRPGGAHERRSVDQRGEDVLVTNELVIEGVVGEVC